MNETTSQRRNTQARELFLKDFKYPPLTIAQRPIKALKSGQKINLIGRIQSENGSFNFFVQDKLFSLVGLEKTHLGQWPANEVLRNNDLVRLDGVFKSNRVHVKFIQVLVPNVLENDCKFKIVSKNEKELFKKWQMFLKIVRDFFTNQGFVECQTPTLVVCPGTEPFLDCFKTQLFHGREKRSLYLPTSPELHLKKLLARGWDKIFEIKPCFRNGEITETHQPEFYTLEWYRSYSDLSQIKKDTEALIRKLCKVFKLKLPREFQSKSISSLFKKRLNTQLTPTTSREDLLKWAKTQELHVPEDSSWDDLFFLLFLEKIEFKEKFKEPTFVEKYPPSQAALARLTEDGWGDRFELYWKGLEIANAFHELNDPKIQRIRFQEDLDKKKALGKEILPMDEEFLNGLEFGMPPSAGIALGLERLFMALFEINDISTIKHFPYR